MILLGTSLIQYISDFVTLCTNTGDPSNAFYICILSIPNMNGGVITKSRWLGCIFRLFPK